MYRFGFLLFARLSHNLEVIDETSDNHIFFLSNHTVPNVLVIAPKFTKRKASERY